VPKFLNKYIKCEYYWKQIETSGALPLELGALGVTRGLALSSPSHFWSTESRDSGVSCYLSKHFNKCICSIIHLYIYIQQQWKYRFSKYIRKTQRQNTRILHIETGRPLRHGKSAHRLLYNHTRSPVPYGNTAHTQPHCTI